MSWYKKYIGIPFVDKGRDESGLDCWGLVRLVYKNELGIDLPSYCEDYESTNDYEILRDIVTLEKGQRWKAVKEPKEFDVIILNMRGMPIHVGIVTKKDHMIHCALGIGTVHEHSGVAKWKHRVAGYARWKD